MCDLRCAGNHALCATDGGRDQKDGGGVAGDCGHPAAAKEHHAPVWFEIHRLENEGDDIYHAAIAELFHDSPDPLTVLKWKEIYEKLEAAVDRCENVANIIESVMIKHS